MLWYFRRAFVSCKAETNSMQKQFFFMKSYEILGRFVWNKIQSRIIYLHNIFPFSSCQDESLFTSKRWIHYNLQICCTRELENYNFRVNFRVIFVAISVFHVLPDFSKTKIIWEV